MTNHHAVYEWRAWEKFLLARLVPDAFRIQAKIDDNPEEILRCLPPKTTHFVFHLNLSLTEKFPLKRQELIRLLTERQIRIVNAGVTDIRKMHIQAVCIRLGLNSVVVGQSDNPSTPVILKSNFNYGGQKEKLLSDSERELLGLPLNPPSITGYLAYQVMLLGEVRDSSWLDDTICIQRYITNKEDKIYRAHVTQSAMVCEEAVNPAVIKKMDVGVPRKNFFFNRHESGFEAVTNNPFPQQLLDELAAFLSEFQLDYGTIDLVTDDHGSYFVIDVNSTPFWGRDFQPGVLEFLSAGLL